VVRAHSKLTFAIDGNWAGFRTRFKLSDAMPNQLGDVTVRVWLDDHVAFERAHVRNDTPDEPISVALSAAKKITLEVDYGPWGDTQSEFVWLAPALLRTLPATSPTH